MNLDSWKTKYFECDCSHPEHVMRIAFFSDEDDPEDYIYVDVLLKPDLSLWGRLKAAFRIMFKWRVEHASIVLNNVQTQNLRDYLDTTLEERKPT